MFIAYFTQQPDASYPAEIGEEQGYVALLFSNRHFNAPQVSALFQERLTEYRYVEAMGFDGIMISEHHNSPFCLNTKPNIVAAFLATMTERVKLLVLGNPLPLVEDPVRLAEEIAMIDLVSQGRMISGFIRGGGIEQLAANISPAYNRDRFQEAHDLIVKTWTEPGPWRWEGDQYHARVVNPWMLPLQKPHPRIFMAGVASRETIQFAAEHRYPYVALTTSIEDTKRIWDTYDVAAARIGYQPGPELRGQMLRVHVADTAEKAIANAREFHWVTPESNFAHPVWSNPPGYNSAHLRPRLVDIVNGRRQMRRISHEQDYIAGTPDQVIEQLQIILRENRPGIAILWGSDGRVSHQDHMRCIHLLGQEVIPAMREYAKELGLLGPFEANAPVSLAATPREHLSRAAV